MIDLAGSERQKSTEARGERLKEASMINKSLSTLGNVINSLVDISEGKSRHVHYRDSKLTFLLKDSLGGNSKTCIIANISSASTCFGETLSTLRFAERAKLVKNQAIINEDTVGTIKELREEIKSLKTQLNSSKMTPSQSVCSNCSNSEIHSNYSLLAFNERIKEIEGLLEQNLKIRLQSESVLQQEIQSRENLIHALMSTIEKYEKKMESDKMVIKFREDAIKRLQKGEQGITNDELREEVNLMKRISDNHPMAAKLFVENDTLREHIKMLKGELKEDLNSLSNRLKENQEFTEKLHISLRKSSNEREQMHILLNEYTRYRQGELLCTPERENRKKLIERNNEITKRAEELERLLLQEKTKNIDLEDKLAHKDFMSMDIENEKNSINDCFSIPRTSFGSLLFDHKRDSLLFSAIKSVDQTPHKTNNQSLRSSLNNPLINEHNFESLTKELETKRIEIQELEFNLKNLIADLELVNKENIELKYLEELTFRLEDSLEKNKDELDRRKEESERLMSELDIINAENEFLSNSNSDLALIIERLESDLSVLKLNDCQNVAPVQSDLMTELEFLKNKCLQFQNELNHRAQEMKLSVQSREQILNELKHLQNEEYSLKKSNEDLITQLNLVNKDNLRLRSEVTTLSKEVSKLAGHNNLSQKIKMHERLKDENNKLKEQVYSIKEELRQKHEKLESVQRKYDTLAKIRGVNEEEEDIELIMRRKIEELESEVKLYQSSITKIAEFVNLLPFDGNPEDTDISDIVINLINGLMGNLSAKDREIAEKEREMQRKESLMKILENEHLLYKHKVELKDFNSRLPLENSLQKYR